MRRSCFTHVVGRIQLPEVSVLMMPLTSCLLVENYHKLRVTLQSSSIHGFSNIDKSQGGHLLLHNQKEEDKILLQKG